MQALVASLENLQLNISNTGIYFSGFMAKSKFKVEKLMFQKKNAILHKSTWKQLVIFSREIFFPYLWNDYLRAHTDNF